MVIMVIIMLVTSISIGFVLGRLSNDDHRSLDVRRRKPPREKMAARPGTREVRARTEAGRH